MTYKKSVISVSRYFSMFLVRSIAESGSWGRVEVDARLAARLARLGVVGSAAPPIEGVSSKVTRMLTVTERFAATLHSKYFILSRHIVKTVGTESSSSLALICYITKIQNKNAKCLLVTSLSGLGCSTASQRLSITAISSSRPFACELLAATCIAQHTTARPSALLSSYRCLYLHLRSRERPLDFFDETQIKKMMTISNVSFVSAVFCKNRFAPYFSSHLRNESAYLSHAFLSTDSRSTRSDRSTLSTRRLNLSSFFSNSSASSGQKLPPLENNLHGKR